MAPLANQDNQAFSEVYAFIGNSLLKPLSQTPTIGLDPLFWATFPDFDDEAVRDAIRACSDYVKQKQDLDDAKVVEDISVEYTRLFIGPPEPIAPPWETLYQAEGVTSGFGEPTFEMRRLLQEIGLQVSNSNNQYEDHLGIELLYLSERCGRAAASEDGSTAEDKKIGAFIEAHPLKWIDRFTAKVHEDSPEGYYERLLALAKAVLLRHVQLIDGIDWVSK